MSVGLWGNCPGARLTVTGLFALPLLMPLRDRRTDACGTGLRGGSRGVAHAVSGLSSRGRTSSCSVLPPSGRSCSLLQHGGIFCPWQSGRWAKVEMNWERLGARQHSALPAEQASLPPGWRAWRAAVRARAAQSTGTRHVAAAVELLGFLLLGQVKSPFRVCHRSRVMFSQCRAWEFSLTISHLLPV